jgi:hypothetical protein
MCEKTCYGCIETLDPGFGGVCSVAGEISDDYAKKEHPECWQSREVIKNNVPLNAS